MTTTTTTKKTVDPVRAAISKVQKALDGLNSDEQQRVLRATGLAFGFDLTVAPSPSTKAYFDAGTAK